MTAAVVPINDQIANMVQSRKAEDKSSDTKPRNKTADIFKKPNMPDRLKGDSYAEGEWKWLAENLKKDGNIMLIYRTALMFHCINVSLLTKAHDRLVEKGKNLKEGESILTAKTPNDYEQISADLVNYNKLYDTVRKGFDDFGMSPKARIKLVRDPGQLALPLG